MGRLIDLAKTALSESTPERGAHLAPLPPLSPAADPFPAESADIREVRPPLSPAALAELPPEDAAYPWWCVSIVGPKALHIELEMRSAWTVSDCGRFARRHYGPDATVVARVRREPEPVTEEAAAEDLRVNLPGVSPEFAARLSAEDLNDIASGDIPLGTVQAFEQAAISSVEVLPLARIGRKRPEKPRPEHVGGLPFDADLSF